jgi:hypothetical protein
LTISWRELPAAIAFLRCAIDERMALVEEQIAHVNDLRPLEVNDRIAARVAGAVVPRRDALVADALKPRLVERCAGIDLLDRRAVDVCGWITNCRRETGMGPPCAG